MPPNMAFRAKKDVKQAKRGVYLGEMPNWDESTSCKYNSERKTND